MLPHDPDVYHWITRAEIKTRALNGKFHSAVKPLDRKEIVNLFEQFALDSTNISPADRFQIRFFRETSSEFALPDSSGNRSGKQTNFFRRQADLLSYASKDLDLHANVVGYGGLGKVNSGEQKNTFINTRGVEVRGMIANKVGFYTFMAENQIKVPDYVNNWTKQNFSVPHEGFWKRYSETGYDFFTARGYFTFQASPFIHFQVGHDRVHIGNGYRSLILSDFGNNYSFARITTQVWKFQYTNLYANLKTNLTVGPSGTPGSRKIPDKFFFFHRLGLNIGKSFNLGLFEAIVAGQASGGVDLSYLNPIIFYRALEQNAGSPDNAGLGLDARWIGWKHFQIYAQVYLDEFLLKEMKAQNGWWGNKYALQGGLHYIDVAGIKNLDIQLEQNFVRPFTYSHLDDYRAYSHYSQPLAHPLGANFNETVAILRYQPFPKWNLSLKVIRYKQGRDPVNGKNYGGNVLRGYADGRVQEYGNEVGQGDQWNIFYADGGISFQPWTQFFLDARLVYRDQTVRFIGSNQTQKTSIVYPSMAVRWNIPQRLHEF
jgi:hypothetical protein